MGVGSVLRCYVGSYCGASEPEAMRVLDCDPETGSLNVIQTVKGFEGTAFLQIDREGRYLYSIIGDERKRETKGSAVRFPLADGRIGPMEVLAALPCPAPCHISLSPDGERMAFAAYGAGTAGTLPVGGGPVRSHVLPDDDMGPNRKRQQKAYAHCAFFTPDGTRLGVVDLGCDRIRFFDPATMTVDASLEIRADPGDGPRHAVWSNDGRFLFVVNELSSTVASCAYHSSRVTHRHFSRIGKWRMLPPDFDRWNPDGETLATKASAIRLTGDGKFLLASNRGHDSIAIFAVDERTGVLSLRNIAPLCGRSPRDFALMPGDRFVVVGHELDDKIQCYRFDREDCVLTAVGDPIPAWRPVCVAFGSQHLDRVVADDHA